MVPNGWEKSDLTHLITIKHGFAFKSEFYSDKGQYVLLTPGSFYETGGFRDQGSKTKYYIGDIPDGYILSQGDMLLAMTEQAEGLLGSALFVPENNRYLHNQRLGLVQILNQEKVCKDFLYLFFNSPSIRKQITEQSTGTKVKHTSPDRLCSVIGLIPPLKEQQKIAEIISSWDQAISATERLLENSQQQKKALMQQLLTGKKRLLDENGVKFSDEWQRIELGLLLDYQQPTPYLVESTAYSDSYETPVLTAGKTFILGYTNESSGIYQDQLPVIIFDDFTTDSKYVNFPFKAKSSAMKILTAKKGVSIKFVFEAMQMLQFTVGGHQRHWISIFSNLVIPLPNKKEQQQIAEVLSLADQEIETLQKKLDCLQQEKKALMQQLLTGKKRVKVAA
ncbi:restriction endonuclease subunit S [Acinetobacter gerneri]|jgi:type I restriction enzyme S subunit|uniref:Restriction endonuclease subunit S n=1 Tax=Acinetobacter gerneri TaxID=202952 RepID=A0AAW8JN47_9GAMM|nr:MULTISPECIES: restriction endonuclease subunit S [Acinetobacter]AZM37249.1 restriction endonuclease subunit S [Acinetobacter baumannii]MDQ9011563.1 restriction endonuclease subunit S [Acinetobacter gerneri]MDQ9015680.1 restriction endonuclease subunit S [Acinetobacter gerneri]MDQ9026851.1 restriction endonuclease subunit S [Acinetobacter gerneri]MDQ9054134.1 restriction endonuclease subunit S [Acinetobacter gerneri]